MTPHAFRNVKDTKRREHLKGHKRTRHEEKHSFIESGIYKCFENELETSNYSPAIRMELSGSNSEQLISLFGSA